MPFRLTPLVAAAACAATLASGCTGHYQLAPRTATGDTLTWLAPIRPRDLRSLERWRMGVGPALVTAAPVRPAAPTDRLLVVSWNTAVGSADVVTFLRDLRDRSGAGVPIVLLLQEAFRTGPDVPHLLARGTSFAARLGPERSGSPRDDVATLAAHSGMQAYYAPSMRNGSPLVSQEDRGNAILSDLPLSELTAIELPFERQRRVAIAATVSGTSGAGGAWSLRLVSAHLDNIGGIRRIWVAGSELARTRQARALVSYLDRTGPVVLAGDFNTWFGFSDRAYRETARAFRAPAPLDRRATFRGLLRLDHVFLRLPERWRAATERGSSRFGSDHSPLITTIDLQ